MVDQKLIHFLLKLQIHPEAVTLYIALTGQIPVSAQALAHKTGIPKTTIYRRIDDLLQLGLVEEHVLHKRRTYTTGAADLLALLVAKKEQDAAELRLQLPDILAHVSNHPDKNPTTKVLYFKGRDGIRQMVWNTLKANSTVVGFTYRDLTPFIGYSFYESWLNEFCSRNLLGRDIYSDEYLNSKNGSTTNEHTDLQSWDSRYVPPEKINIQCQIDIYNNVVGMYNWVDDEVFGVEIHNTGVATVQKQLFELAWAQATKIS